MLQELSIQNLAVISAAEIPLEAGLNVFTGETGAGKSILIHGIQAVLGQRISKDIVRTGCKKASITARFSPVSAAAQEVLAAHGIAAEDDELFLTREISADGGSTGRLNGKAVPVALLRELGDTLVNIHGQHDNQILLRPERHLDVLDHFGDDCTILEQYRAEFAALQKAARELGTLKKNEQEKLARLRQLQAIIEEISAADPQPQEDTLLEEQYRQAVQAQAAEEQANALCDMLTDGEQNVSDVLVAACGQLSELAAGNAELHPLAERLKAVNIELRDIADELAVYGGRAMTPAEFRALSDRRNLINTLAVKYHTDADGLRALLAESLTELTAIESSSERLQTLNAEKQQRLHTVTALAKQLTAHRQMLAEQFSARVGAELSYLDMPRVQLVVQLGIINPEGNPYVRVTDLERTFVDCCDKINRAGGAEELLHCCEGLHKLNEIKIMKYLDLYGKAFLYQKVGFLLERIQKQINISTETIELCRNKGALHTKRLTNDVDSDCFVSAWKLYVPSYYISENTESYDLI